MARFRHSYWLIGIPLLLVTVVSGFLAFKLPSARGGPEQSEAVNLAANLGLTYLPVTGTVPACYGLGVSSGALVTQVSEGSLLSQAGVIPGDVITSFNGVPVAAETPLLGMIRTCHSGDDIILEVWNSSGIRTVEINSSGELSKRR